MKFSKEQVWERIDRIVKVKYKGNLSAFARALGYDNVQRLKNRRDNKDVPLSLVIDLKEKLGYPSDFILFGEATTGLIPPEILSD